MRTGAVSLLEWVSVAELAALAAVDRTTAMRWRRGDRPAPSAVLQLLAMYHGGHVGPRAGPAWSGFWFDVDGQLRPPDLRAGITAGELRAFLYLRAQGLPPAECHTLMTPALGLRSS